MNTMQTAKTKENSKDEYNVNSWQKKTLRMNTMWTAKIQLRQKKTLRMNTAKTKENSKDEYNDKQLRQKKTLRMIQCEQLRQTEN